MRENSKQFGDPVGCFSWQLSQLLALLTQFYGQAYFYTGRESLLCKQRPQTYADTRIVVVCVVYLLGRGASPERSRDRSQRLGCRYDM